VVAAVERAMVVAAAAAGVTQVVVEICLTQSLDLEAPQVGSVGSWTFSSALKRPPAWELQL
jgi:hypothetical protein